MKRRQSVTAVDVGADGVPAVLLVGACVEVWASDVVSEHPLELHRRQAAARRYRDARADWLASVGLEATGPAPEPLRSVSTGPWSFAWLLEHDPGRLAEVLAARGLPPDWTPAIVAGR